MPGFSANGTIRPADRCARPRVQQFVVSGRAEASASRADRACAGLPRDRAAMAQRRWSDRRRTSRRRCAGAAAVHPAELGSRTAPEHRPLHGSKARGRISRRGMPQRPGRDHALIGGRASRCLDTRPNAAARPSTVDARCSGSVPGCQSARRRASTAAHRRRDVLRRSLQRCCAIAARSRGNPAHARSARLADASARPGHDELLHPRPGAAIGRRIGYPPWR